MSEQSEPTNGADSSNARIINIASPPVHEVYFRFCIKQTVRIVALTLEGVIEGRRDYGSGHDYRVIFYSEQKRNDSWLFEHELREK